MVRETLRRWVMERLSGGFAAWVGLVDELRQRESVVTQACALLSRVHARWTSARAQRSFRQWLAHSASLALRSRDVLLATQALTSAVQIAWLRRLRRRFTAWRSQALSTRLGRERHTLHCDERAILALRLAREARRRTRGLALAHAVRVWRSETVARAKLESAARRLERASVRWRRGRLAFAVASWAARAQKRASVDALEQLAAARTFALETTVAEYEDLMQAALQSGADAHASERAQHDARREAQEQRSLHRQRSLLDEQRLAALALATAALTRNCGARCAVAQLRFAVAKRLLRALLAWRLRSAILAAFETQSHFASSSSELHSGRLTAFREAALPAALRCAVDRWKARFMTRCLRRWRAVCAAELAVERALSGGAVRLERKLRAWLTTAQVSALSKWHRAAVTARRDGRVVKRTLLALRRTWARDRVRRALRHWLEWVKACAHSAACTQRGARVLVKLCERFEHAQLLSGFQQWRVNYLFLNALRNGLGATLWRNKKAVLEAQRATGSRTTREPAPLPAGASAAERRAHARARALQLVLQQREEEGAKQLEDVLEENAQLKTRIADLLRARVAAHDEVDEQADDEQHFSTASAFVPPSRYLGLRRRRPALNEDQTSEDDPNRDPSTRSNAAETTLALLDQDAPPLPPPRALARRASFATDDNNDENEVDTVDVLASVALERLEDQARRGTDQLARERQRHRDLLQIERIDHANQLHRATQQVVRTGGSETLLALGALGWFFLFGQFLNWYATR